MIYQTRTISIAVMPTDDPIYSETVTTVSIEDESGGEFVIVDQSSGGNYGKIAINPEEWPTLRNAIDKMINECRGNK